VRSIGQAARLGGVPARCRLYHTAGTKRPRGRAKELIMAKNTGEGFRKGAVRDESQSYNPTTGKWTKRDRSTGRFMDGKADGTPFKGVRKEKP